MKIVKSKKGKRFVCLKAYSPLVLWYILVNVWNVFIYCTDTQRHTLQNETHGFCWGKHPIVEDLYFIKRKTNILNISIQNFVVIIYFSSSFNFLFINSKWKKVNLMIRFSNLFNSQSLPFIIFSVSIKMIRTRWFVVINAAEFSYKPEKIKQHELEKYTHIIFTPNTKLK